MTKSHFAKQYAYEDVEFNSLVKMSVSLHTTLMLSHQLQFLYILLRAILHYKLPLTNSQCKLNSRLCEAAQRAIKIS